MYGGQSAFFWYVARLWHAFYYELNCATSKFMCWNPGFQYLMCCCAVLRCSVLSNSLWPHGLQLTSLLCPLGFSRQEYWSGLPCPPPRNLPDPEMEPTSLTSSALAGRFFIASATWEAPYRNPLVVKQSQWVAFLPSLWPVSLPWAMCRDFVSLSPRISHLGHKNWICILRTKGLLVDSSFFRYGQIR